MSKSIAYKVKVFIKKQEMAEVTIWADSEASASIIAHHEFTNYIELKASRLDPQPNPYGPSQKKMKFATPNTYEPIGTAPK
jgi:hypothetical protein